MKFIFYFNILFLFFKSIKSLNFSCDGCSKVVLNTINNIVFTLDVEPQLIKILYKGTIDNPIQYIYLNITKKNNGEYLCNDTFSGYDLAINLDYLVVVGYQNQDHNTNVYMKFHNYMPNKIDPEQILNSIDYNFYVYLENNYLNNDLDFNIKLISQNNSLSYNANNCQYNRTLNYLSCRLNINKIGTYYLKVDDITFDNITLEVLESNFQVLEVRPNYEININERNFYLTLNVDSKLYSPLGHSFEFIIADGSTENRKIILSNCVIYDLKELYCNQISDYFKPRSVYYFYYNQIKLENKNIQTGELKYPDFQGIEAYDNYYIIEGQSNIKKFYINVDDTDSVDNSQFYLIDENKTRTNLNNCNDINSTQILCECDISKSGEYYISYNNYTIPYKLNFINDNSETNSNSLLSKVYPTQVRYGDINIELTFNEDAYKYKNNVTIGNYSADCDYYASKPYVLECDLYISRIGEYKIYVNKVDTGKILNVNTVTIDDDSSSSSISYFKLNIFYLVFIFILFLFNF